MTLDRMIAAHDDNALAALANKGLLRRALRDAGAGLARIVSRDAHSATVTVDGLDITLTAAGPRPADCPCPATGQCRHLLTAVIALRDDQTATAAGSPITALPALLALTDRDITRFAGADLTAALSLATTEVTIDNQGAVIAVTLPDSPAPVQFLAGHPLKDTVFKGPASRKRLAITAALLALRTAHGKPVDTGTPPQTAADDTALPIPFLDEVAAGLETLLLATLRGGAQISLDQVFALALSARAQAAPRLTGALRALVSNAETTLARKADFDAEDFATRLSETYALVQALKQAPDDPALRGSLQRSYEPAAPFDAMVLGAAAWFSPSGARGMTVYAYDTTTDRWISTGHARAGGADPGFTPLRAYDLAVLGPVSARDLIGQHLHVPAPRLTADGQLSPSTMTRQTGIIRWPDLQTSGAIRQGWTDARADLQAHRGQGLRQPAFPAATLLAPARIEDAGFDVFRQEYRLHLRDKTGDTLTLTVSAQNAALRTWLLQIGGKLRGLLCSQDLHTDAPGLTLTPVAAILAPRGEIAIFNFAFDRLPQDKSLLATLAQAYSPGPVTAARPQAALQSTCADVIRAVVDQLSMTTSTTVLPLDRIAALGLTTLHRAATRFSETRDVKSALPTLYIAWRLMG